MFETTGSTARFEHLSGAATILRPLMSAMSYATIADRKSANSEVLLQTDNDAEITSCKKIIRTSNRLLGSYYSGLVQSKGLEPLRFPTGT